VNFITNEISMHGQWGMGRGKDGVKSLIILFILITDYTVVDHQYTSND